MSWTAAIIGGSTAVGSGLSYMGSQNQASAAGAASSEITRAAKKGRKKTKAARERIRKIFAPWQETGVRSLADLERVQRRYELAINDPSTYEKSPGFDWLQKQGINALDRSASSRGKLDSGQHSKDLVSYNQGLALQDYGGYLNRLQNLMDRYAGSALLGERGTNRLAGYEYASSKDIGESHLIGAGAQAQGITGQANAQTGLYNNLSNIGSNAAEQYMFYNALNRGSQDAQNNSTSNVLWDEEYDR